MAFGIVTVAFGQEETTKKKRMNASEKFASIDQNGDGFVSYSEFTSFERPERPQREGAEERVPKDPQEIFTMLDADGDSLISLEEFEAKRKHKKGKRKNKGENGLQGLTEEEKAEIKEQRKAKKEAMKAKFQGADVDGDERISYAEFTSITFDNGVNHEELFNKLDANGDGFLEKGEIKGKRKGKKKEKNKELETTQS